MHRVQQLTAFSSRGALVQILRRRVGHGNFDLFVVLAAGHVPRKAFRRGTANAGGSTVGASVAVRGLVMGTAKNSGSTATNGGRSVGTGRRTAATMNPQRQPVVIETGAHTCKKREKRNKGGSLRLMG